MRNKNYCFENKQLSKEEYNDKVAKIDLGSYRQYQACAVCLRELSNQHCFRHLHYTNTQNCFGDYLRNCKDTNFSFDCEDVEGGKFCYQIVLGAKNIYDINQYGTNLQESYECCITGADSYHLMFVMDGHMASSDLLYCWYLESCRNCFGCVSMHHRSYCILNKQYSKEEYEKLVPRIIEHMKSTGEWGEFFDSKISLFGYNKTTASMYYPMKKEEILERGWKWDDYESPMPDVEKIVMAKDIPDNIDDIPDAALSFALKCEITGKLFKITTQELQFYRKHRIPLPRRAPYQRHLDRFSKRNPRKFWKRACAKCDKEIETTYAPDRPEKVYCEKCYLKTIH